MKYLSTSTWRDLTDGHLYQKDEPFPFDGRAVPNDRLTLLASNGNKAGIAVIRAVEEPDEETQGKASEPSKATTRGRKKADAE